jgi:methylated-DNA-protein-cysteine methyltransferase-like protein
VVDDERFFQKVYSMVQKVSEDYVVSYGQIAFLISCPHAARIVGYALYANPDPGTIPCH